MQSMPKTVKDHEEVKHRENVVDQYVLNNEEEGGGGGVQVATEDEEVVPADAGSEKKAKEEEKKAKGVVGGSTVVGCDVDKKKEKEDAVQSPEDALEEVIVEMTSKSNYAVRDGEASSGIVSGAYATTPGGPSIRRLPQGSNHDDHDISERHDDHEYSNSHTNAEDAGSGAIVPSAVLTASNSSGNGGGGGANVEITATAMVVDETAMDEEIERRVQEKVKEVTANANSNADGSEKNQKQEQPILANAVAMGEDGIIMTDPASQRRRTMMFGCLGLLLVIIVIIVSVTVSGNSKNGPLNDDPPTPPPTSEYCLPCADGNDPSNAFDGVLVSITPLKSCRQLLDETTELSVFDPKCRANQADAALKCGCAEFPKLISMDGEDEDDDGTSPTTCTFCPKGFYATSINTAAGVGTCSNVEKYVQVMGEIDPSKCDAIIYDYQNDCRCQPIIRKDDDESTQCAQSISEIFGAEAAVEDTSVERTYMLCPNTTYTTGVYVPAADGSGSGSIENGDLPLFVRPNARVVCGKDGRKENNCVVGGGTFGAVSTPGFVFPEILYDNVRYQGITFANHLGGGTGLIAIMSAANITFVDCVFKDNHEVDTLFVQPWGDGSGTRRRVLEALESMTPKHLRGAMMDRSLQDSENVGGIYGNGNGWEGLDLYRGAITFDHCLFERSSRSLTEDLQTALLSMERDYPNQSPGPDMTVRTEMSLRVFRSVFLDNSFKELIRHNGNGEIEIVDSCFIDNNVTDQAIFHIEEKKNPSKVRLIANAEIGFQYLDATTGAANGVECPYQKLDCSNVTIDECFPYEFDCREHSRRYGQCTPLECHDLSMLSAAFKTRETCLAMVGKKE